MDMATLTHKTTILLSPEDHLYLKKKASQQNTTIGDLIRTAIKKVFLKKKETNQKKIIKGWEKIFKMNAPVSDWEEMEKEIIKGWLKE